MKTISIYVYKTVSKLRVKILNSNGRTDTVFIEPCHESWEQYGAIPEVLYHTMPIAEFINDFNYFRSSHKFTGDLQRILTERFVER